MPVQNFGSDCMARRNYAREMAHAFEKQFKGLRSRNVEQRNVDAGHDRAYAAATFLDPSGEHILTVRHYDDGEEYYRVRSPSSEQFDVVDKSEAFRILSTRFGNETTGDFYNNIVKKQSIAGNVDPQQNPFGKKNWIDQGYGLTTEHRAKQLEKLFDKAVLEIKRLKDNEGSYPAFVGIRWGFAKLQNDKLFRTEKWKNRISFDEFGNLSSEGIQDLPKSISLRTEDQLKAKISKKQQISEKDMEDLIVTYPEKYIGEVGLKLIKRQFRVDNYRFDLLFEDRRGAKLIVEIQKGTLDRNHTYKILDYYDAYKKLQPSEFIELMVIANKVPYERRTRLSSHGIEYREIPITEFAADLSHDSVSVNETPSDNRQ